jgi:hypothetical protein
VENTGSLPTPKDVSVDFWLNADPDSCPDHENTFGEAFATIPAGLQPAALGSYTGTLKAVDAGEYSPMVWVDGFHEIVESTYDDNCLPYNGTFVQEEYLSNPDLVVEDFVVKMAEDGNMYYKGKVRNIGYVDIQSDQPFKTCVYFGYASAPGICETPDMDYPPNLIVEHTGPMAVDVDVFEFGKNIGRVENGSYCVWARADCDCQVMEVDEKNNDAKGCTVIDLPGPDLKLKPVSYVETCVNDQTLVTFTVPVTNGGTDPVPAGKALMDIFPTCTEPPYGVGDCMPIIEGPCLQEGGTQPIDQILGPGETMIVEWVWQPAGGVPAGTYDGYVVLDSTCAVPETIESNNIVPLGPVNVAGCGAYEGPNLTLIDFKCTSTGSTLEYPVTVKNTGDQDISTQFRIDLFYDRETAPGPAEIGDALQLVEGLKSGAGTSWTHVRKSVPDGEYYAWVCADSDNKVAETNEGDNCAGPRICVVNSQAVQCEDGVYLKSTCVCGGETIPFGGYCCDDVWYAVGCPAQGDAEAGDAVPDGPVVEMVQFGDSPGCGCRVSGPPEGGRACGVLVVLLLACALFSVARVARRRS